jgi:hypothetical protein
MAKKRDRHWTEHGRGAEDAFDRGAGVAHEGMSFAGNRDTIATGVEDDIEAWGDDEKTAPDLFADASAEDQMQAGDGHSPRPDEEQKGRQSRPNVQRR